MQVSSMPRIWVTPLNDGEAVEIARLLGEAGERVLTTAQAWGASWAGLEPETRAELERFRAERPDGDILGVELAGPNGYGARNIDHHRYQDEDRSHPLSALEQTAEILGVDLDRRRLLVAANDRGYIPAMRVLGATDGEVADVRRQDREAQGVGAEQERRAAEDVKGAQRRGDRVLVRCAEDPTSAHADALFEHCRECLLAGPGEWNYYGPRHQEFAALGVPEKHWSGGAPNSGYFGVRAPGEKTRRRVEELFWE
jgi:hypothetical protein